jgi:hypothetical protein
MDILDKLTGIVDVYFEKKTEENAAKKEADVYNADIKTIMGEQGLTEFSTDTAKASITIAVKNDFIENRLIEVLKDLKLKNIVKKKEYVDMDALEDAIYKGKIDPIALKDCQTSKEVITLRVTAIKKKKEEIV